MINSFGPCLSIDLETGPAADGQQGGLWLAVGRGHQTAGLALRLRRGARGARFPSSAWAASPTAAMQRRCLWRALRPCRFARRRSCAGRPCMGRLPANWMRFSMSMATQSVDEIKGLTIRRMAERGAPQGRARARCGYGAVLAVRLMRDQLPLRRDLLGRRVLLDRRGKVFYLRPVCEPLQAARAELWRSRQRAMRSSECG